LTELPGSPSVSLTVNGATVAGGPYTLGAPITVPSTYFPSNGGVYDLAATYAGSTAFGPSATSEVDVSVGGVATTTSIGALFPTVGVPFNVTVNVANVPSGATAPGGTVTLYLDGALVGVEPVGTTFNGLVLDDTNAHALTAVYSGDANHGSSTGTLPITATADATTVGLTPHYLTTAPGAISGTDGANAFTLTVTNSSSSLTPTGTVTFVIKTDTLATVYTSPLPVTVSGTGGTATAVPDIPAGTLHYTGGVPAYYTITATYTPGSYFTCASPTDSTSVTVPANGTAVSVAPVSTVYGTPGVTLTATVTPTGTPAGGFAPSGTVDFYLTSTLGTHIGSAPVVAAGAQALRH
jgi:hypothetical protein